MRVRVVAVWVVRMRVVGVPVTRKFQSKMRGTNNERPVHSCGNARAATRRSAEIFDGRVMPVGVMPVRVVAVRVMAMMT